MLDAFLKVASAHDTRTAEYQGLVSDLKMLPYADLRALADGKSKLASMWGDNEDWLDKFHGSPFYEHALGIQQQDLEQQIQADQRRLSEQEERPEKDMARDEEFKAQDRIRLQKRILELELNKWKLQSSGAHVPGESTEPQPQQHQSVTELPKLEPQGEQPAGPTMAGIKQAAAEKKRTNEERQHERAKYLLHAAGGVGGMAIGESVARDLHAGHMARRGIRAATGHVPGRLVGAGLGAAAGLYGANRMYHHLTDHPAHEKKAMNMAADYAKRVAQAAAKQKILPGATGGSFAERLLKDRAGTLAGSAKDVASKYTPSVKPNDLPVSKYLGGRPALTQEAAKHASAFAAAAEAMGLKKESADPVALFRAARSAGVAKNIGGAITQGLGGAGRYLSGASKALANSKNVGSTLMHQAGLGAGMAGNFIKNNPGTAAALAAPVVGAGYLATRQ